MSDDSVKTELDLGLQSNRSCPLWVISRPFSTAVRMSAFGGKADVNHCVGECPLLAISGHWWANENGGSGEPDRTPHLHNGERPRECDWHSIRLAVHSGATSAGRKPMTTPKTKFASLALIAGHEPRIIRKMHKRGNAKQQPPLAVALIPLKGKHSCLISKNAWSAWP